MANESYITYIDTGGTFTDCIIVKEDGSYVTGKSPTTPDKLEHCFFEAIEAASANLGKSMNEVLRSASVVGYGTTQGTNVVVTGQGAPNLGFITTRGHEDRTLIMRLRAAGLSRKDGMRIARADKPVPLIPRKRIRGVVERIDCKGKVVIPLDEESVKQAAMELIDGGVQGIAVGLLWSFLNQDHERRIKEIIQGLKPDLPVTVSSEISPIIREYPRFTATMIDLYIGKALRELLETIKSRLAEAGYERPFLMMQAYGGLARSERVKPGTTLHSGPVGGVTGVDFLKTLYGFENAMGSDVGGTSFDICFSPKGEVAMLREPIVGRFEISNPMREIMTIGAGGGTVAFVDDITHTLRVGPESAGAVPGPACYDKGGIVPTVTDADVVLNRVNPNYFLGGRMKLNRQKSFDTIKERIAEPLKLDVMEAAEAMCKIIDGLMQSAISTTMATKGIDPKQYALFCYGGGGPSHCAGYTNGIEFSKVIIPSFAAVFSAFGASTADVKHRYEASPYVRFRNLPYNSVSLRFDLDKLKSLSQLPSEMIERFNAIFEMIEKSADADMEAERFRSEEIRKDYEVSARYVGQLWELRCAVRVNRISSIDDFKNIVRAFEDKYVAAYTKGAMAPRGGLEIIGIAVEASGTTVKPKLVEHGLQGTDASHAIKEEREVYFDGKWWDCKIYRLEGLRAGNVVDGPAIIEGIDMTVVVPPTRRVSSDQYRNFVMDYR
ncbi:MAG: hydantoinase/oxoprolinase family protein [Syntrophorhabdales bacterium]|jgi:N-methylhydantoinase A/oxoprolinase/acetone carboxylase beta subunit